MFLRFVIVAYEAKAEKGKLVCFLKQYLCTSGGVYITVVSERYLPLSKAEALAGEKIEAGKVYSICEVKSGV